MERLNKYIAECGICSRRKADEMIASGKVKVNGKIITELGYKINENDNVSVDNKLIKREENKVYILLNKPKGVVTTLQDEYNRKKVTDLVNEKERVYPIGRLDKDTSGLLILTNDGEFANRLMHPKNEINKTYVVKTDSLVTDEKIEKLRKGVDIGGYVTKEAKVEKISNNELEITIHEGKNRQVRRMCACVNINVVELKRIKYGKLTLEGIETGKYRYLTKDEINYFK